MIDRFEGEHAVVELEDGKMKDIKKSLLPDNAKEGDVLIINEKGIKIDKEETHKRKEEIKSLMDELFE
ncbi:MAG: hypothetical protein PWP31_1438 [Clostridia bacterium]|nr:hypothetical protein [Clostridia bacterium]MDK2901357.1 hypothetical protein [Thermosediminibacterales bacterium]